MGNVELRLTLADIKSELAEVKSIGMDTHDQASTTNGKVAEISKWKEQMQGGIKVSVVFMGIITAAMGWLTVDYLNHRNKSITQIQIQSAVDQAFQNYKTSP